MIWLMFVQANKDNGTKLVDSLNAMLAEGVEKYELLDMTKIDHFYLDKSEEMYWGGNNHGTIHC